MTTFGSYESEVAKAAMHGKLSKKGRTLTNKWLERYYIVKGKVLAYYRNPKASTPSKEIPLDGCTVFSLSGQNNLYGFEIRAKLKNYSLYAASEKECQDWIAALQKAITGMTVTRTAAPTTTTQTQQQTSSALTTQTQGQNKTQASGARDAGVRRRASYIYDGVPPNFSRDCTRVTNKIEDFYVVGKELGSGGFSTVRLGTSKEDGSVWALKMILNSVFQKNKERTEEEIKIHCALSHPGIAGLKEVVKTSKYVVIVLELLSGGELFDRIVSREKYSEDDAKMVAARLLDAVAYLHRNNIVHRDLKPENLLFTNKDDNAMMKLTDFGFATVFDGTKILTETCGTPEYVAPEILDEKPYGLPVDMWSCGVIIYIILCGFPPFYGNTEAEMFDKICSAQYTFPSPFWDAVSEDAKDLIDLLLELNPKKRLTAEQALEHSWLKKTTTGLSTNLSSALVELKRYNATKKFRKAVIVVLAANKLRSVMKLHGIVV